jgi:hypothetical protein
MAANPAQFAKANRRPASPLAGEQPRQSFHLWSRQRGCSMISTMFREMDERANNRTETNPALTLWLQSGINWRGVV